MSNRYQYAGVLEQCRDNGESLWLRGTRLVRVVRNTIDAFGKEYRPALEEAVTVFGTGEEPSEKLVERVRDALHLRLWLRNEVLNQRASENAEAANKAAAFEEAETIMDSAFEGLGLALFVIPQEDYECMLANFAEELELWVSPLINEGAWWGEVERLERVFPDQL